jgi:hypothetical protein
VQALIRLCTAAAQAAETALALDRLRLMAAARALLFAQAWHTSCMRADFEPPLPGPVA